MHFSMNIGTNDTRNTCHIFWLAGLSLWFSVLPFITEGQNSIQEIYQQALSDKEEGKLEAYLSGFQELNRSLPNNPTVWLQLAKAWSLNGNADSSFFYLMKRTKLVVDDRLEEDINLDHLKSSDYWSHIFSLRKTLTAQVGAADTAFVLLEKDFHPECIAYDSIDQSWLIGSVRKQKIIKWKAGQEEEFIPPADEGLGSVMSIAIDHKNGHFFVANVVMPEMEGFKEGYSEQSSIHVYNLKDGLFLHKIDHYDATNEHVFGEIVLDASGLAYISDSYQPYIFLLDNREGLSPAIVSSSLRSPQGMALHPDSALLYVADYIKGLVVFDRTSKELKGQSLETDLHSLKGIDGLYWYDGSLIAIQNGSIPKRILQLELSEDGTQITESKALFSGHEILNEPTQGFILGDQLYFIANSPWAYYVERRELETDGYDHSVILKLDLK